MQRTKTSLPPSIPCRLNRHLCASPQVFTFGADTYISAMPSRLLGTHEPFDEAVNPRMVGTVRHRGSRVLQGSRKVDPR